MQDYAACWTGPLQLQDILVVASIAPYMSAAAAISTPYVHSSLDHLQKNKYPLRLIMRALPLLIRILAVFL